MESISIHSHFIIITIIFFITSHKTPMEMEAPPPLASSAAAQDESEKLDRLLSSADVSLKHVRFLYGVDRARRPLDVAWPSTSTDVAGRPPPAAPAALGESLVPSSLSSFVARVVHNVQSALAAPADGGARAAALLMLPPGAAAGASPDAYADLGVQERVSAASARLRAGLRAAARLRGPECERPAAARFVGLANLGATCYAGVVLQALFHDAPFRAAVYRAHAAAPRPLSPAPSPAPSSTLSSTLSSSSSAAGELAVAEAEARAAPVLELARLFGALQAGARPVVSPAAFLDALQVDVRVQQDANEFFSLLLALLDRCGPQTLSARFRGTTVFQTRCTGCGVVGCRASDYVVLELVSPKRGSLFDALEAYMKPELVPDVFCDYCGCAVDAVRSAVPLRGPPVLALQLMRFGYDAASQLRTKSADWVSLPSLLKFGALKPFGIAQVAASARGAPNALPVDGVYDLAAVVCHVGESALSGHYRCYVADDGGQWWRLDDSVAEPIGHVCPFEDARRPASLAADDVPYMVFYRSQADPPLPSVEVPDRVAEDVELDNIKLRSSLDAEAAELDAELTAPRATLRRLKEIVQALETGTVDEQRYWMPRAFLREFIACDDPVSAGMKPDQSQILCEHGALSLATDAHVRVSAAVWELVVQAGGPAVRPVTDADFCLACVARWFEDSYHKREQLREKRSAFAAANADAAAPARNSWFVVSANWLRYVHNTPPWAVPEALRDPFVDLRCDHGGFRLGATASITAVSPRLWSYLRKSVVAPHVVDCLRSSFTECPKCAQVADEARRRHEAMIAEQRAAAGLLSPLLPLRPQVVDGDAYVAVPSLWTQQLLAYLRWTNGSPHDIQRPPEIDFNALLCPHGALPQDPIHFLPVGRDSSPASAPAEVPWLLPLNLYNACEALFLSRGRQVTVCFQVERGGIRGSASRLKARADPAVCGECAAKASSKPLPALPVTDVRVRLALLDIVAGRPVSETLCVFRAGDTVARLRAEAAELLLLPRGCQYVLMLGDRVLDDDSQSLLSLFPPSAVTAKNVALGVLVIVLEPSMDGSEAAKPSSTEFGFKGSSLIGFSFES
jgi:hypothetical protein